MIKPSGKVWITLLGLGIFSFLWIPRAEAEIKYIVKVIQFARSVETDPQSINNVGDFIGFYYWNNGSRHAFIYRDGTLHDLGTLSGYTNIVIGLNNRAQTVGYFDNGANLVSSGTQRAYLHDRDGTVTDLGSLNNSPYNFAGGINDCGVIVGSSGNLAFVYQNHQMKPLGLPGRQPWSQPFGAGFINNRDQIIGNYYGDNGQTRTGIYNLNGQFRDIGTLLPAVPSIGYMLGYSMNDHGVMVGVGRGKDLNQHGFLYDGVLHDLGAGRGVFAINNSGLVVGADYSGGFAFLYTGGQFQDLNQLIDPRQGYRLGGAFGINDSGQIVARGRRNSDGPLIQVGFLLTPIKK